MDRGSRHKKYGSNSCFGFNLIEAAIVLGVIGLIIGGIWIAASSYTQKQNAVQLASNYFTISNGAIDLYRRTPATAPISATILAAAGIFPSTYTDLGADTRSIPFTSDGYIYVSDGVPANNNLIAITYVNLPVTYCISIVQAMQTDLSRVSSIYFDCCGSTLRSSLPFSTAQIVDNCTNSAYGDGVTDSIGVNLAKN